jgi:hypothetical protein
MTLADPGRGPAFRVACGRAGTTRDSSVRFWQGNGCGWPASTFGQDVRGSRRSPDRPAWYLLDRHLRGIGPGRATQSPTRARQHTASRRSGCGSAGGVLSSPTRSQCADGVVADTAFPSCRSERTYTDAAAANTAAGRSCGSASRSRAAMSEGCRVMPKPRVGRPVSMTPGRATEATRYSPSARRLPPWAMTASTVPDMPDVGGLV